MFFSKKEQKRKKRKRGSETKNGLRQTKTKKKTSKQLNQSSYRLRDYFKRCRSDLEHVLAKEKKEIAEVSKETQPPTSNNGDDEENQPDFCLMFAGQAKDKRQIAKRTKKEIRGRRQPWQPFEKSANLLSSLQKNVNVNIDRN